MGIFSKILPGGGEESYLALDVGTEVVKALVFNVNKNEKRGVVIGVGRKRQKRGNMQSGAVSDISGVIETCQLAVNKALENAKVKKVKKAIVGIAGELVKGTTTTVHYERGNSDARIDFPELKNIIQKVQMKAYERIQDQISWETGQNVDVKLINAAIVDVRIDGYQVTNPIGFQGKDVSISIFNAYAPIIHLGALQTIADELKVDLLSIAAEPYAVARSVDYEDVLDFSAIFIDIGGGTTDIAVVRNGGLEGTKMFAFGGKSFTKKLAQELRIDFDEAEALKIRYSEGKLGSDISLKVEQILQSDCAVWLSGVELSLAEFTSSDVLPSKILLCGGGSGLPGIKKALMSREWTSNLPFAKTISVGFMQPRDVARISDMTNELTNPQDVTPMGLANLVLDVTGEEKVMSGILRRVLHTIQD
ncbi:MAG TPA: cell division FtsA domain-containing protein [Candidatus Moranbacteria bacterium]|jgi:cell division protein FtsA|nr:cell division FtsA domain-containing protein [Candidatus Moranbacteria bacterium]HPX94236.1 cell division FtsA domain-containing protein [Candidatus Moranbacteria bacterium]HQB59675.1 cell division FtsA domain-containing protein [Candidatus Moranbacteria bacterium]